MLSVRQLSSQSSRRDAWVEIDLGKLEKNIEIIKSWLAPRLSGRSKNSSDQSAVGAGRVRPLLLGSVKADAYGHGAVVVGEILQRCGASWLGVATVDEGIELRDNGISLPILILSPTPKNAMKAACENSLDITISALSQLKDLAAELGKFEREARIHVKVDTGMHRLGMPLKEIDSILDQSVLCPQIHLVSVFSHLAKAAAEETTKAQNELFLQAIEKVQTRVSEPILFHIASSDAARLYPFSHHDMVRIGIALYGLESWRESTDLLPILSLRGRINQLTDVEAGESVGYGHRWQAGRPARVANVPIGYADGVDRGLSNRIEGLVHGKRVPQVGIISMDQMLFDVTEVPEAGVGSVVTLIGSDVESKPPDLSAGSEPLSLASWARKLDTITYEMAVRLRVRLPRRFVQNTDTLTLKPGKGE
jgi:alanine racemase